MHNLKGWMVTCIVLVVLAAFFFFCLRGYSYISYTLLFIAFFIAMMHICPKPLKTIVILLTCVGLLYFCAVETLIFSSARTDKNPERSYLVVLGAAVHGRTPSLSLLNRLTGTLNYLENYPGSKVIVCGGQGKGEDISEAQCMKDWLLSRGIAEERILPEDQSTSTMENLSNARDIILAEGGSTDDVAILSSNYHLYRAKQMAKSLGMNPVGVASPMGYPVYTVGMFIREAFGVTHLWAFGN